MKSEVLKEYSKYCPQCKKYHRKIYTVCPDCNVPLGCSVTHHTFSEVKRVLLWGFVIMVAIFWLLAIQHDQEVKIKKQKEHQARQLKQEFDPSTTLRVNPE